MEYKIYKESHPGAYALIIELIITMFCLELGYTLHPAIRLIVKIAIGAVIFVIFTSSKIGCIIISLFYSIAWSLLICSITNEFSHGDIVWIVILGGITFLINIVIHLSSIGDSGSDYIITKYR